jgi:hypothetical protein
MYPTRHIYRIEYTAMSGNIEPERTTNISLELAGICYPVHATFQFIQGTVDRLPGEGAAEMDRAAGHCLCNDSLRRAM